MPQISDVIQYTRQTVWDPNTLSWVPAEQAASGGGGVTSWGTITGTLANQTDLNNALSGKAATSHTHAGTYEPADAAIQAHLASAHAPANAEQNVNADWNAASGDAQILNKPTLGTASALNVPATGDAAIGEVVKGNDSRLTDARTPTAHTQAISTVTGLQTALDGKSDSGHTHSGFAPSGGTTGQVLKKTSNTDFDYGWAADNTGGAGSAAWGGITGTLSDQTDLQAALNAKADSSHTHAQSDVTNLVADLAAKQATSAKNQANGYAGLDGSSKLTGAQQVYGTSANTACQGNDARLSDARTPTQHSINGAQHSFPGGTSTFLRADGAFATPSGGGGGFDWTFVGALANDVSTGANTTPVDATGLVFTYEANAVYAIEVIGRMSSASSGTGCGVQFNVSSTITDIGFTFFAPLSFSSGTVSAGASIADDASVALTSAINANNQFTPFYGAGVLRTNGNTGTCQMRYRSEVNGVSTLRAGTILRVHKVA
jgi:hypothetical protein